MDKLDPIIYEVLERYNISKPDITEIIPQMAGINYVYKVLTNKGIYILKEYRKKKSPQLDQVHALTVCLINQGANIPKIFPNSNQGHLTKVEERNFDLSEFIPHIDLSDQVTISKENLMLAGKTLAAIQKQIDIPDAYKALKKVDFSLKAEETLGNIESFNSQFEVVLNNTREPEEKHKLKVLKEIIADKSIFSKNGISEFISLRAISK